MVPAVEVGGGPVVGTLGCGRCTGRCCNGGAMVCEMELLLVLLPLSVHVVVVVAVVDLSVNVS